MKEYRNRVDAQHAPQELIEGTIQYIHEMDQTANKASLPVTDLNLHKQKAVRRTAAAAAIAVCLAACLIVFIGRSGQPRFSYHTVSDIMFRDRLPEMYMEEWSLQEYEAYLGTDLIKLPEEYKLVTSKIYVKRDGESQSVLADEGTFYLEANGCVVILKSSKSGMEVPEELLSGSGTDINGVTVYVGENAQDKKLLAAFWQGDVEYYLICNDMSKRQFEKMLRQMF